MRQPLSFLFLVGTCCWLLLITRTDSAQWSTLCGNWNDPSNWLGGQVPAPADSVELNSDVGGPYSVLIDTNIIVEGSLTIQDGVRLVVRADLAVLGSLILESGAIVDLSYSSSLRVTVGHLEAVQDTSCTILTRCSGKAAPQLEGCSSFKQAEQGEFAPGCQWQVIVETTPPAGENWIYIYDAPPTNLNGAMNISAEWSFDFISDPDVGIWLNWNPVPSGYILPALPVESCTLPDPTAADSSLELQTDLSSFTVQFDLEVTPNHIIHIKDKCGRTRSDRWVDVRFVRISEIRRQNGTEEVLRFLDFDQKIYAVTAAGSSLGFATSFFQPNSTGFGTLNFLFQVFTTPETLLFGGVQFDVGGKDGKWSMNISNWGFDDPLNNELKMEIALTTNDETPFIDLAVDNSTQAQSTIYSLSTSDYTLKLGLLNVAEVEGVVESVVHSCNLLGGNSAQVLLTFPGFGDMATLVYDPVFSILVGDDSAINDGIKSCEEEDESSGDDNLAIILIAVLIPAGIAIGCIAIMLLAVPVAIKNKLMRRRLTRMFQSSSD